MKRLIINGVEYCRYEMEPGELYLKVLKNIGSKNELETESILIQIISIIEMRKFKIVGYLNIEAE